MIEITDGFHDFKYSSFCFIKTFLLGFVTIKIDYFVLYSSSIEVAFFFERVNGKRYCNINEFIKYHQ